jgi:hypothetical protein
VGVASPRANACGVTSLAAVHLDKSAEDDNITAIRVTEGEDSMRARGELVEVLDDALTEALGEDEDEESKKLSKVDPHVDVPGRGKVSKHTLVLELNKRKAVGKDGDALSKLDTSRLRRVKQASKDGGDRVTREATNAVVSWNLLLCSAVFVASAYILFCGCLRVASEKQKK